MDSSQNNPDVPTVDRTFRWITWVSCVIAAVCFVMQFPLVLRWKVGFPWIWVAPFGLALSLAFALVFSALDGISRVQAARTRCQQQLRTMSVAHLVLQIAIAITPLIMLGLALSVAAPWLKSRSW
jgi:hypothetical protein